MKAHHSNRNPMDSPSGTVRSSKLIFPISCLGHGVSSRNRKVIKTPVLLHPWGAKGLRGNHRKVSQSASVTCRLGPAKPPPKPSLSTQAPCWRPRSSQWKRPGFPRRWWRTAPTSSAGIGTQSSVGGPLRFWGYIYQRAEFGGCGCRLTAEGL